MFTNKLIQSLIFLILLKNIFGLEHEIPDALKTQAKKLHEMCQKQHAVDAGILSESATGNLPNVENFKCYLHCLLDKVGLISEDLIIHLEYLNEVLPEYLHEIINNLVAACGTKIGANGCETAYNTINCYIKSNPKLFQEIATIIM